MLTPLKFVEFVLYLSLVPRFWIMFFYGIFCLKSSSGVGVDVMVSDCCTVFVSSSFSVGFLLHSPPTNK